MIAQSDLAIMRRTGHTSAASLHRYDRPSDLLDDARQYLGSGGDRPSNLSNPTAR
jgi:hypothetical protein